MCVDHVAKGERIGTSGREREEECRERGRGRGEKRVIRCMTCSIVHTQQEYAYASP